MPMIELKSKKKIFDTKCMLGISNKTTNKNAKSYGQSSDQKFSFYEQQKTFLIFFCYEPMN